MCTTEPSLKALSAKHARTARAVKAGTATTKDLDEVRREYKTARLAEHIRAAVESAPPLSASQRRQLAALLRPAPESEAS